MLTLSNLCFEAAGNHIIRDISADFEEGSFSVITGPNGGGKSTLARLIMGMERPTSGQILWDGKDISGLTIDERAKLGIGYAFQQPARFKGMSVRALLTLAHGKALSHDQACAYLSAVGLCANEYLDRDADASLSGGELKRIEIATLLARDLRLAIFDEPEAGIDLWSFAKLVETFQQLHENPRLSILLISHQERIMNMADEILIVENGKITQRGKREAVLPTIMQDLSSCEYKR
ncbi:MAG: ATP-binding cassette domain-containing protein [Erysipelotrichaceae bacterium]|nr:ATP-binding cassette domain-containing protein [Erysipelotrichaceae bacterium]MCI9312346.1 ATP-binding cassette domain-containing protein [Erysipelotrichaceae bacterium]